LGEEVKSRGDVVDQRADFFDQLNMNSGTAGIMRFNTRAASMVTIFDILPSVQKPVSDRVKAIRQEIADIREANRIAVGRKNASAAAEQERRLQRLLEIRNGLGVRNFSNVNGARNQSRAGIRES